MNLAAIVATFLFYGMFITLYESGTVDESTFPTFDAPGIEFETIPDSCSGFTDCIEYVGNILVNFVLGIIFVVLLIVAIIVLLVELLIVASTNAFTGAEGLPIWLNAGITAIFGIALAVVIYRMVRKGDTDTA